MQTLIDDLNRRRIIGIGIVTVLAIIAVVFSYNFKFSPSSYFGGKYNDYFVLALIIYKVIELSILYYILLYRHIVFLKQTPNYSHRFPKIKKHTKLLLFLVPQGNIVFGIIAYKLSANVFYFLVFLFIAVITLYIIKPNKLTSARDSSE